MKAPGAFALLVLLINACGMDGTTVKLRAVEGSPGHTLKLKVHKRSAVATTVDQQQAANFSANSVEAMAVDQEPQPPFIARYGRALAVGEIPIVNVSTTCKTEAVGQDEPAVRSRTKCLDWYRPEPSPDDNYTDSWIEFRDNGSNASQAGWHWFYVATPGEDQALNFRVHTYKNLKGPGLIQRTPECSTVANHAMLAVGYGEYHGIKYWMLKNSWGPTWGDNGYVYMERGVNACHCEENAMGISVRYRYSSQTNVSWDGWYFPLRSSPFSP